jgi:exodeoxyribonuclease VII large subunit
VLIEWQQTLTRCHPRILLADASHRVEACQHRLGQSLQHRLNRLEDQLRARGDLLRNLGPDSVLARGFSFTTNAAGKVLKDAAELTEGEEIVTQLHRGKIRSRVEKAS